MIDPSVDPTQTLKNIETILNDMNQSNKTKGGGLINKKILHNLRLIKRQGQEKFVLPNKTNRLMSTHARLRFN